MYTAFVRMLWDNDRAMMQEAKQYVHATDHLADTLKPKKRAATNDAKTHALYFWQQVLEREPVKTEYV